MSSIFFVTSLRLPTRAIKKLNGATTIKRGLALGGNYCADGIDSRRKSRSIPNNARGESPRSLRWFGTSGSGESSKKAILDGNNVLSSPFPDVQGFTGIYLHELVYRDLDRWADKTALVCSITGRGLTYGQMRKLSGRLATSLRKSNIRPGDTVAIVLPNVPEFPVVLLAGSEAGVRMTLINPASTEREMRKQIEASNASAIFTTPSKHPVVAASVIGNPKIRLPIVVIEDGTGPAPAGTIKFQDLITEDVEEFEKTGEKTGVDPEDTLFLPYSSGTSGLPKGVELSHRNIVANILQVRAKGVSIAEAATANHQEVLPLILPMYHIYGLAMTLSVNLCMGAKLVTLSQFTIENMFKLLENNRSTLLYLAPPLVQMLANDERLRKRHMEAVKVVVSGAAPIAEDVLGKLKIHSPEEMIVIQGYGLSETSPCISMSVESSIKSTGHPIPNTQIRIVGYEDGNKGKNLGVDEVGEIFVRGPQVMKGYYNNPKATADTMDGDWLKTGDLGSYDEKGLLYIRGRLKELIKVQGMQVAPAEIEHLIQTHEKVADAAVIGVPHEMYGEVPKAFVVPKNGVKIDHSEIKDFVAKQVSKYKRLGHVEFIDKIPKSAAGKILRRELEKL